LFTATSLPVPVMVLLILSTFFLNAGLICCATYWLMQDSDHRSGHVDRDSFVKNALSIVFVWEKLNYIHAVATLVIQLHWVLKLIGFASIGTFIFLSRRGKFARCVDKTKMFTVSEKAFRKKAGWGFMIIYVMFAFIYLNQFIRELIEGH